MERERERDITGLSVVTIKLKLHCVYHQSDEEKHWLYFYYACTRFRLNPGNNTICSTSSLFSFCWANDWLIGGVGRPPSLAIHTLLSGVLAWFVTLSLSYNLSVAVIAPCKSAAVISQQFFSSPVERMNFPVELSVKTILWYTNSWPLPPSFSICKVQSESLILKNTKFYFWHSNEDTLDFDVWMTTQTYGHHIVLGLHYL